MQDADWHPSPSPAERGVASVHVAPSSADTKTDSDDPPAYSDPLPFDLTHVTPPIRLDNTWLCSGG